MTHDELIEAGFKQFSPNEQLNRWDVGFQCRVRDAEGTRYFINVFWWRFSKYSRDGEPPIGDSFELHVVFNEGCEWFKTRAALEIKCWSNVDTWSPADVIAWADQLWQRLQPVRYEPRD